MQICRVPTYMAQKRRILTVDHLSMYIARVCIQCSMHLSGFDCTAICCDQSILRPYSRLQFHMRTNRRRQKRSPPLLYCALTTTTHLTLFPSFLSPHDKKVLHLSGVGLAFAPVAHCVLVLNPISDICRGEEK